MKRDKGAGKGNENANLQSDKESYSSPNRRFIDNDKKDEFDRIKRPRRRRWWTSKDVSECGAATSSSKSFSGRSKHLLYRISR